MLEDDEEEGLSIPSMWRTSAAATESPVRQSIGNCSFRLDLVAQRYYNVPSQTSEADCALAPTQRGFSRRTELPSVQSPE